MANDFAKAEAIALAEMEGASEMGELSRLAQDQET